MSDETNTDPGTTGELIEGLDALTARVIEIATDVAALSERLIPFQNTVKACIHDLNLSVSDLQTRVDAVESARVTPVEKQESDPVCECGHHQKHHGCGAAIDEHGTDCPCEHFRPAAPPAPTETVDPVLFHLCEAYRICLEGNATIGQTAMIQLAYRYFRPGGSEDFDSLIGEILTYGVTS